MHDGGRMPFDKLRANGSEIVRLAFITSPNTVRAELVEALGTSTS